jgi:hypothetical protein
MHLSLAKEHRDYFQKHNYIEFTSLLSPEQTGDLAQAIEEVLLRREKAKHSGRDWGRDLWREHPFIKKIALRKDFAEITGGLTGQRDVRMGYDQAISIESGKESILPTGTTSLQQTSCVKPLLMGLLIRLSEGPQTAPAQFPCPCPTSPGSGIFFSAQLLLSWEPLLALHNQRFFLIAYAGAHPIYILEKRDPCTHALKNLGYVFGDSLKTDTHPLLYANR